MVARGDGQKTSGLSRSASERRKKHGDTARAAKRGPTDSDIEKTYTGLDRELAEEFIEQTMDPNVLLERNKSAASSSAPSAAPLRGKSSPSSPSPAASPQQAFNYNVKTASPVVIDAATAAALPMSEGAW